MTIILAILVYLAAASAVIWLFGSMCRFGGEPFRNASPDLNGNTLMNHVCQVEHPIAPILQRL